MHRGPHEGSRRQSQMCIRDCCWLVSLAEMTRRFAVSDRSSQMCCHLDRTSRRSWVIDRRIMLFSECPLGCLELFAAVVRVLAGCCSAHIDLHPGHVYQCSVEHIFIFNMIAVANDPSFGGCCHVLHRSSDGNAFDFLLCLTRSSRISVCSGKPLPG